MAEDVDTVWQALAPKLLLALKEQYILRTPLSTLDSINEDRYYRKLFFWNPVPSLTCQFQTFDSQTLQSEMANIPQRPDISAVVDAFETLAAQATLAQTTQILAREIQSMPRWSRSGVS